MSGADTTRELRAEKWFSFKNLADDSENMRMVRQGALLFWIIGSSIGLETGAWLVDPAKLFGGELGAPEMMWAFVFGGIGAILGGLTGKWVVDRQYSRGNRQ